MKNNMQRELNFSVAWNEFENPQHQYFVNKIQMILNEWYCKLHLQCTMNDEDLIMTRFINDGYNNYR